MASDSRGDWTDSFQNAASTAKKTAADAVKWVQGHDIPKGLATAYREAFCPYSGEGKKWRAAGTASSVAIAGLVAANSLRYFHKGNQGLGSLFLLGSMINPTLRAALCHQNKYVPQSFGSGRGSSQTWKHLRSDPRSFALAWKRKVLPSFRSSTSTSAV